MWCVVGGQPCGPNVRAYPGAGWLTLLKGFLKLQGKSGLPGGSLIIGHTELSHAAPPLSLSCCSTPAKSGMASTDVRDVAAAHTLGAFTPGAKGRYIVAAQTGDVSQIVKELAELCPGQSRRSGQGQVSGWISRTHALACGKAG